MVICCAALVATGLGASDANAGMLALSSSRCGQAAPYSFGSCPESIWTVRDDGTDLRRLTGGDGPVDGQDLDEWPSWSPDGLSLLFRRTYPDVGTGSARETLQVQSILGGSASQVGPAAPNPIVRAYTNPSWSPDGRSILFSSRISDQGEDSGKDEIYLMGMDGSIRQVTHGPPYYYDPQFSRDGRRVLAQRAVGDGTIELTSLALDGSDPRPIFLADMGSFQLGGKRYSYLEYAVSPDGRTVVLNRDGNVLTLEPTGAVLQPRTQGPVFFPQAGRLAYADEPADRLIRSGGPNYPDHPLEALSLTGPDGTLKTLLAKPSRAEADKEPAWRPTVPQPAIPDLTPPSLNLSVVGIAAASARRKPSAYPRLRRGAIRFAAFDAGGIRRLEASIAKVGRTRKGRAACRFLESRRFGRRRACRRPLYHAAASVPALRRILGRLPAGRYKLTMRVRDVNGRPSRARGLKFSFAKTRRARRAS